MPVVSASSYTDTGARHWHRYPPPDALPATPRGRGHLPPPRRLVDHFRGAGAFAEKLMPTAQTTFRSAGSNT